MADSLQHVVRKWGNTYRFYIEDSQTGLVNVLREHSACFLPCRIVIGSGGAPRAALKLDEGTFFDPNGGKVFERIGGTGGGKGYPLEVVVREISFLDKRFHTDGAVSMALMSHRCARQ